MKVHFCAVQLCYMRRPAVNVPVEIQLPPQAARRRLGNSGPAGAYIEMVSVRGRRPLICRGIAVAGALPVTTAGSLLIQHLFYQ